MYYLTWYYIEYYVTRYSLAKISYNPCTNIWLIYILLFLSAHFEYSRTLSFWKMSTMCQPRFYFYRWKRIFIPISNRGTTYHDKKRFIICMKKFNEFKIFVFIIIICEDIPIFSWHSGYSQTFFFDDFFNEYVSPFQCSGSCWTR